MKKLKKLFLINKFILTSLALCISLFAYAAEKKEIQEAPILPKQFDTLPTELQFQILLERVIEDINEAETIDSALKKLFSLKVNSETREIINSNRFVAQIMPALLNFINRAPILGLRAIDVILKVPFIKEALTELQKKTNTANFLAALLTIENLEEPLVNIFLTFTKETIAAQFPDIQFATGLDTFAQILPMRTVLANRTFQDRLLSDEFLASIHIINEENMQALIQQLLMLPSKYPELLSLAKKLIEEGADINKILPSIQRKPIMLALSNKIDPEVIKFYLQSGATFSDSDMRTSVGRIAKRTILGNEEIKQIFLDYANDETKKAIGLK